MCIIRNTCICLWSAAKRAMPAVRRSAAIVIGAGVAQPARQAASEVDVGGFHDRAIATTQQDLMGDVPAWSPQAAGPVQMRMDVGPTSALTASRRAWAGSRSPAAAIPQRICRSTRPTRTTAAAARPRRHGQHRWLGSRPGGDRGYGACAPAVGTNSGTSELVVGGQLAVSGLRVDAAVGRDSAMLGEAGNRVTAGVGYDFGRSIHT